MKKWVSLFLIAAMLICVFPVTVQAETLSEDTPWTVLYRSDSNSLYENDSGYEIQILYKAEHRTIEPMNWDQYAVQMRFEVYLQDKLSEPVAVYTTEEYVTSEKLTFEQIGEKDRNLKNQGIYTLYTSVNEADALLYVFINNEPPQHSDVLEQFEEPVKDFLQENVPNLDEEYTDGVVDTFLAFVQEMIDYVVALALTAIREAIDSLIEMFEFQEDARNIANEMSENVMSMLEGITQDAIYGTYNYHFAPDVNLEKLEQTCRDTRTALAEAIIAIAQ